ncbi:TOMM precursor leader peptide-binding protein [Cellulomonas sp. PSBB021]|uniref:TOMM precursor leader peptide-binding protein n=1 Tax=Cellulomonas sp. PSBB021 TaxID=2003551 RepID=UPI000B8D7A1C|nr:TOMM precursor leader peptide-binding protein [Cellulomonas sp. PSBB021]ASR56234.1 bacteriocin biosynthesis protein SagD [Cellulomonas sp. PSBB021]
MTTVAPRFEAHRLGLHDELAADAQDVATRVLVAGSHGLVGPFPGAGDSGASCGTCLARRWQAARDKSLRDALELGGPSVAVAESPFLLAFQRDAVEAVLAAAEQAAAGAGPYASVYRVDLESLEVRRVPFVPDAECPRCGTARDDVPLRPELTLAPKPAPTVFRSRPLDDYGLETDAYANPVSGALGTSMWFEMTSRSTAPAYGTFGLRAGEYLRETLYGGHADSVRVSTQVAVLEGLERAAGLRPRGRRTAVHASLAELGDGAVDPRVGGLYRDEFYEKNPHIQRFDPQRPIPWVWGWSLRDDRAVLVPENLAYYHAGPVTERFVQETSNGCASGSSLTEATYHGLMELVERDAFLVAWFARRSLPEIDPRTSALASTRCMVDRLDMYGYEARFFDARLSFDIPVVVGVAVRRDGGLGTLAFGAGAGLDPEAAIAAALCEIGTDCLMAPMRVGWDRERYEAMAADFTAMYGLHDHPHVYGLPQMRGHAAFLLDGRDEPRSVAETFGADRPAPPLADDLRTDLAHCVEQVAARGFDVVVVDQTTPEQEALGLHTVSVTVPGLVPIDFGWLRQRAPHSSRVRTALREAGLMDRDLRDDEINPAPHPFP